MLLVLLAKATRESITGTSTNTPTTVVRVAPEFNPKILIATATANSKKLEVQIMSQGSAIRCGTLRSHAVN